MGSAAALRFLDDVISFLGELRGVCPVPPPDAYLSSVPCIKCFFETAMLPNQGESVLAILGSDVNCTHLCCEADVAPIMGVFENELKHLGVDTLLEEGQDDDEQFAGGDIGEEAATLRETSLKLLADHTIFESVDASLSEISNLMYWNSGDKSRKAQLDQSSSHMAKLLVHESRMHNQRAALTAFLGCGFKPTHFFDVFSPSPIEALFCGGIFNSVDDTISSLQKDCSVSFLKKSNFQTLIKRQNELFVRLNDLLHKRPPVRDEDCSPSSKVHLGFSHVRSKPEEILSDAQARKDQYMQKLTKDGLRRLHDCMETQGKILRDTLSLRVWGNTLYDSASKLKNHFLFRAQFACSQWIRCDTGTQEAFDNSKYIKNTLHTQKLSHEHIDSLVIQFYKLVTGPLSRTDTHFPVPDNVSLAYCLDAAGVMPHQKLLLTEMIWPTIQTKDWIDTNFNQFYTIEPGDLNSTQKRILCFIREAVLSVSLYNRVWEKDLNLFSTTDSIEACHQISSPPNFQSGVYLTYEDRSPLILVFENKGFIFKDLYSLLYYHLQLSGQLKTTTEIERCQ